MKILEIIEKAKNKANLPSDYALAKSTFRREAYRKAYHIEEKIRRAKSIGQWPPENNSL